MSNSWIKPKKQKKRLRQRIKGYENTIAKNPQNREAYTKPGSLKK